MAVEKIRLGTNEDGTPHFLYRSDGPVVFTGSASGVVTLKDGSEVDVSELVVEAKDEKHARQIADAIAAANPTVIPEG